MEGKNSLKEVIFRKLFGTPFLLRKHSFGPMHVQMVTTLTQLHGVIQSPEKIYIGHGAQT